jgi:thiol-disulfide isomerase/thioredoxin
MKQRIVVCIVGLVLSFTSYAQELPTPIKALPISLPNTQNVMTTLDSVKGKLVLLDFWATWCGPCIKEIPKLKKLYKKYKPKGLEVFSMSIDEDKKDWQRFIKRNNMNWIHVIDIAGWQSSTLAAWHIEQIPTMMLLDSNKNVIAYGSVKELEPIVKKMLTTN